MEKNPPAVVALGMFDGVHLGHKALIAHTVEEARSRRVSPVVCTFSNHPMEVLGEGARLLTDIRERNVILRSLGVESVQSEPFTEELARLSPEAFVERLLARWDISLVVTGYNYTFGAGGAGTAETLGQLGAARGFGVDVIPPVRYEDEPVSSTRIRAAVERGEVERAAAMLGRPYSLSGRVVRNRRIGRRIGFPTANIEQDARRVLPREGVYATYAYVGGAAYRAVTNIGANPTVGGERVTIETHLIDFGEDIYDRELTVAFRFFLRGEETFKSVEAMREQIEKDVAAARAWRGAGGPPAPARNEPLL